MPLMADSSEKGTWISALRMLLQPDVLISMRNFHPRSVQPFVPRELRTRILRMRNENSRNEEEVSARSDDY